jgi:putative hemolysin
MIKLGSHGASIAAAAVFLLAFHPAWSAEHGTAEIAEAQPVGMANPAAVFCLQKGGQLIPMQDEHQAVHTLCQLPDGRRIEEWALFRCSMASPNQDRRPECDDGTVPPVAPRDGGKN